MILDLLITFILCIFILYPFVAKTMNTIPGKSLFLVFTYFVIKYNIILGLIAGIVFVFQFTDQPTDSPKFNFRAPFSLLPLDENMRPKDSSCIPVDRNSVAPPREELSGFIDGLFADNTIGSYAQINL